MQHPLTQGSSFNLFVMFVARASILGESGPDAGHGDMGKAAGMA